MRDDIVGVIAQLREFSASHSAERYYQVRHRYNHAARLNNAERAAMFVYLNKTCFNGLHRVNRRGEFNVPAGRYTNPRILDEERVRDFTLALRQAGAEDVAQRIESYAAGFIDGTQVRRSVDAIKQQLQYYRACPHELPDLPIVQIAANRLEDVCKDALRAGMIEPARPSLRAASKRKLSLVTTTLSAAGVLLLLPLLFTMLGVDLNDLFVHHALPPLRLLQGDDLSARVNVLVPSQPAATSGTSSSTLPVTVHATCPTVPVPRSLLGPRAFGILPSYEVMMDGQAYGVFVAFSEPRMLGAVGTGRVLVAASTDTPEGHYALPLQAAFLGYAPEQCGLLARLQRQCEPAQRSSRAP